MPILDGDQSLIVTDDRGWPKMSGIHDSRLTQLSLDFGKRMSFIAAGVAGEKTVFVLDGTEMLNIVNLWEGVIVDSVAIWSVAEVAESQPEGDCRRAWTALLDGRVHLGDEVAAIMRAKREHENFRLVSVSSSYGGGLHALCRDVKINGRRVAML